MAEPHSPLLPSAPGAALPRRVTRQAIDWLVALQADEVSAETHHRWQHWLQAHPDHTRAWQHLEQAGACLRSVESSVAHGVLTRPEAGAPTNSRRRTLCLLALGVAGGSAWLGRDTALWHTYRADLHAATGSRHTTVLADGTELLLDSGSAIDIDFSPTLRRVVLRQGRVLVETAHTPDPRPFVVETPDGRVRALGTRFSVSREDAHSAVQVFAHAVEISPAQSHTSQRLSAGEQARFTRAQVTAPSPLAEQADAWTHGMLVAHRQPLGEVIAVLARYRPGRLHCDPAVAHLPVSGVYPLDDTDCVLDMLVRTQPITLARLTRYWVTVQAR